MRRPVLGVIGTGKTAPGLEELALEVGRQIARCGAILVCGGLGGVMEAAARGAKEAGGITLGILPGAGPDDANRYIDIPVATNMGQARNAVIVHTADALIAVDGEYGTLSEMAMALKIGKPVIALEPRFSVPGLVVVKQPKEAVEEAISFVRARCPRLWDAQTGW
ncbi:MAG TPA: TIGR00725 family protein [Syntrophobacteraceae bacterium]|nr:TIGR00725 family protein [Syntrophobacteraceae bacterium]